MSTFTKPMPLAWQNKPASSDYAATQALGVNETDAGRVYARAVQLGRFRFGWSVRQCDFLKTEAEQWTGSACLALGKILWVFGSLFSGSCHPWSRRHSAVFG